MISKFYILTPFLIVLLTAFAGRVSAQENIEKATTAETEEKTPEVSTSELRAILREHSATVLDIRPFKDYAMGHIPGASNVAPQPGVSMSLYISDADQVGRLVHEKTDTPIILYCDGPSCDKSKSLADELLSEGYTNVKRYQLGLSVWRALGGTTQIELAGVALVMAKDRTATFVDARDPQEYERRTLPGAINLPPRKLIADRDSDEIQGGSAVDPGEKQDAPLPIEDHNTRVIVFGDNAEQASMVAAALVRQSFTNVSFFGGSFQELLVAAMANKRN